MNTWIQIFKAGAYPGKIPITAADLQQVARDYDPAWREAPLVVGHPDTDSPAHGWVEKLRVVGDTLWAKVRQVSPELQRMVTAGAFKHISLAMFLDLPAAGRKYLRHVGFLGGSVPAVPGMHPVQFAAGAYESFDDLELPIGEALDRQAATMRILDGAHLLMERIYGLLDDDEIADTKQAILDQVDSLRSLVEAETFTEGTKEERMTFWQKLQALFADAGVKVPGEEPPRAHSAEGTPQSAAAQFTEAQVLEREQAAVAKAQADAEAQASRTARETAVRTRVAAFVDAGIAAGTFLPAWRDAGIPQVIEQGLLAEPSVTFAEGQPPTPSGEILLEVFASLPKLVPLGERAAGGAADPDAALKAEFSAGAKVHEQMGVTFEVWKLTKKR